MKKRYWARCVIIGLLAAVASSLVFAYAPTTGGDYPPGYGKPVTAFEFAHSPADVELVFGALDDPARPDRIEAMRKSVYADFPFIAFFGMFLAAFFFAAFKQSGQRIWLWFSAIGIIAAIGDVIEDVILLGILDDPIAAPLVSVLAVPVYVKFAGLGITNIAAGVFLAKQTLWVWKLLGLIAALSGIATLAGLIFPLQLVWVLASAVGVGWIMMLIYAIARSFTERSSV